MATSSTSQRHSRKTSTAKPATCEGRLESRVIGLSRGQGGCRERLRAPGTIRRRRPTAYAAATRWRRRRAITATRPKPPISISQLDGSGTAVSETLSRFTLGGRPLGFPWAIKLSRLDEPSHTTSRLVVNQPENPCGGRHPVGQDVPGPGNIFGVREL